ncbi:hypothetical protein LZK98_16720 [Sphingomonas cannabina]|uniref:hypothetical protein n=1 Tax=Sphingomonas cannabina TaxID=2899123 RepID=UPI001F213E04|nr:hypothetical protein [Sphingomonas cannabina]UIJ44679.1 hypothetical protein LZK98_16720 [Sphingomonas cannabina]
MKRLFGGLLLAAGILIMACSGLCSLVVVVSGFEVAIREPSAILLPLIIGGVPFAIGFGAFTWGRWLLRQPDDEEI